MPNYNRKAIEYRIEGTCHICTSHQYSMDGYPKVTWDGKQLRLNRVVFEQHYRKLRDDEVVRHTCNTRACINPQHLIAGSHADNVNDRVLSNRSAKGESNGRAKLSWQQVDEIRAADSSVTELAKKHSVDRKTIRKILDNKMWKR